MASIPKRRRVKRATIVAIKRSQLAKNNLFKKRSYKPLYEKLKANNHALAKALSKEKQECQYLFNEKIGLTSEVQELKVACNQRDDAISGALKNAKETLQLLITMSNCVTNTIASCQQMLSIPRCTPRKSSAGDRRESTTRRMSGKSPARGVVQPMVSGHTITKPTINLSRLNIQRAYRVQNPPNLSDIEESLTPEASPVAPARTSPVRVPITRPLNMGATRVNRLPERLQNSMRASDESERRSSARSNRNSSRHSARRSRENSEGLSHSQSSRCESQTVAERRSSGGCLRSPRVALHDVSRLLQNSQSVNIRTLLENSSDMEVTHVQQQQRERNETPMNETSMEMESREMTAESSEDVTTEANTSNSEVEPSEMQCSDAKSRNSTLCDTADPLEGPSWLLNSTQGDSLSSQNETSAAMNDSTPVLNAKDQSKNNRTYDSDESSRPVGESFVNSRSRRHKPNNRIDEEDDEESDKNDENEQAANLATRWANQPTNFFKNLINNNDDDDFATTNLSRFVNRKRGSTCDDDDFTLMMKPENRKNYNFDLNDLQLPVIESPLVAPVQPTVPEPEQTTNVQRIVVKSFANFTPDLPRVNGEETLFNHTGLMLPFIGEDPGSARPSAVVEQDSDEEDNRSDKRKRKRVFRRLLVQPEPLSESEAQSAAIPPSSARPTSVVEQESDDEDAANDKRTRKRSYKRRVSPPDSPSEAEWAPTPKRKNIKQKRKPPRVKDPSSAKVVLQKINVKARSPSPVPRLSQDFDKRRNKSASLTRDASSDSDMSSNASATNTLASGRPRRQKAPTNLQEPSLGKKMRRN